MKKYIKVIFILFVILIFVQQCTEINLIPNLVKNKEEYKYLSEGVSSTNYALEKISDNSHVIITYDTVENYFIIDDGYNKTKLNSKGDIIFNIPHPSGEIPDKSHLVFTDSTICDLSKDTLEFEPFFKKIYPSDQNKNIKWMPLFEEYYNKSSSVIYCYFDKIYFKIKEGWVEMNMSDYFYLDEDIVYDKLYIKYPAKYKQLIYLKDIKSNTYSDWMSHSGSSIDREYNDETYHQTDYTEKELIYPNLSIQKITFEKKNSSEKFAYTPIISQFIGDGYYKLKKNKEYIYFKENGCKYPFRFFESDYYLNYFTLPTPFETKTDITFIKYSFPSNQNESNSQGLYLVKRK